MNAMMYYATLIASFTADDEVEARLTAEVIRENAAKDLEDDDEIWVAQTLPVGIHITPHAKIQRIRAVRNDLIRLKKNDCFDVARELDKIAWALEVGDGSVEHTQYSYGDFLDLAGKILAGEEVL